MSELQASKPASFQRLISLDALRGFTIAAMVIVNDPGSWEHVYAPLQHARWHGLTATDLVFPFFLFIVGVSIAFAYTTQHPRSVLIDAYASFEHCVAGRIVDHFKRFSQS